jgi:5,10-methylenetetrahydrofolate reductase
VAFQRIIEVFPPMFPGSGKDPIDLEGKVAKLVAEMWNIKSLFDLTLVANVKNPVKVKLSTIISASLLQSNLRINAVPSIVARDENRLQLASSVLTAIELGLHGMMLVWGDRYPAEAHATNVRDYHSLAEVIREAAGLRRRAGSDIRILAPVDLRLLRNKSGIELARSRLRAGAQFLLAQPPTTDAATLDVHLSRLETTGLKKRVMLNVFPFRDGEDVRHCEEYFGWKLPKALHTLATRGRNALLDEARDVQERIRAAGLPGVYVSTRGTPAVAKDILG